MTDQRSWHHVSAGNNLKVVITRRTSATPNYRTTGADEVEQHLIAGNPTRQADRPPKFSLVVLDVDHHELACSPADRNPAAIIVKTIRSNRENLIARRVKHTRGCVDGLARPPIVRAVPISPAQARVQPIDGVQGRRHSGDIGYYRAGYGTTASRTTGACLRIREIQVSLNCPAADRNSMKPARAGDALAPPAAPRTAPRSIRSQPAAEALRARPAQRQT
jgi:hypothetical protein